MLGPLAYLVICQCEQLKYVCWFGKKFGVLDGKNQCGEGFSAPRIVHFIDKVIMHLK